MERGNMPLITETEFNDRVEKYVEEIRDLKSALKYANALYHGKLLKIILDENYCPVCRTHNLSHGKDTILRQESGSLSDQQGHETATQQA